MKIATLRARQIIDSRALPALECVLTLDNGTQVVASVPEGASIGRNEAKELRDGDMHHFGGKGVLNAIAMLHDIIAPALVGKRPDVTAVDQELIALDGTADKSRLGANTILAVSMAVARAQAFDDGIELYQLINRLHGDEEKPAMPQCMYNLINGGFHGNNGLAFQEFMVMPRVGSIGESLEYASGVYWALKKILIKQGLSVGVGDEGGYAPLFKQIGLAREFAALDLLDLAMKSVQHSVNAVICLDVAAATFFDQRLARYTIDKTGYTAQELVAIYEDLCNRYQIASIEDGLDQDDWVGWQTLTKCLGGRIQLVGDDIFVTNQTRITQGIEMGVANAVLIKPNQIGTVSEALEAVKLSKKAGYKTIVSHRSGETNDTFIADFVVGTAAGQYKGGAPARGERVAKYNRLLAIEEQLLGQR